MIMRKNILLSVLALAVVAASTSLAQVRVVEGEYLLMMTAKNSLPAGLEETVSGAGGQVLSTIPEVGMAVAASDSEDFVERLEKDEEISGGVLASR